MKQLQRTNTGEFNARLQGDSSGQNAQRQPPQEARTMTKLLMLALMLMLLITISGLSACNTMEGAGQDIQSGGDALSGAARDVKEDM